MSIVRRRLGLSQKDVARLAGLTRFQVYRLEASPLTAPHGNYLKWENAIRSVQSRAQSGEPSG